MIPPKSKEGPADTSHGDLASKDEGNDRLISAEQRRGGAEGTNAAADVILDKTSFCLVSCSLLRAVFAYCSGCVNNISASVSKRAKSARDEQ